MALRLEGKAAVIVGAGQTPGDTIGNGRAMSILFAREGARVMLVDRRIEAALQTKWGQLFKSYGDGQVVMPGMEPKTIKQAAMGAAAIGAAMLALPLMFRPKKW